MSITTSAIISEYGAYYQDAGQNKKRILTMLSQGRQIINLAFVVQDSDGQKYLMGDKLRPAVYAGSPDGFGTGKETAARKGISMESIYKTPNLYIYPGNIPLTEALPG